MSDDEIPYKEREGVSTTPIEGNVVDTEFADPSTIHVTSVDDDGNTWTETYSFNIAERNDSTEGFLEDDA